MRKSIFTLIVGLIVIGCNTEIKNSDATVLVEEGTEVEANVPVPEQNNEKVSKPIEVDSMSDNSVLGYWVGYFEQDGGDEMLVVDDGYYWNKNNKINISIDKITDSLVVGHSVVAGNDRPFKGTIKESQDGTLNFVVREPGDDKYDGEFRFSIADNEMVGKWTAYGDINIKNRKYTLEKKVYHYDPDIMLDRSKAYVDWTKAIEHEEEWEIEEGEVEKWISKEFASATDQIYHINASNTPLAKSQVENLKKGDLTIIRNTIYARHGYSFKNQPLRVFFDAQDWYIPVHNNIKDEFTDLEKQNIELLLKYEKNALEYYDRFGRG